jgi:hypothetical protein
MTEAFECRLDVFDGPEPLRYAAARQAVKTAVEEIRELADGYAARLRSDPALFVQAAEWIALERRCCPFLGLGLNWSEDNFVWLSLTGGPGVKEFLTGVLASRS